MPLIKYVTDIHFDFGAANALGELCAAHRISPPLIVTDKGVIAAGVAAQALAAIEGKLLLAEFDETPGNPTEAAVDKAVALYRDHKADGSSSSAAARRSIWPRMSRSWRVTPPRSHNTARSKAAP